MTIEKLHRKWDKTNRGRSACSEHDLQTECVRWLRYQYPQVLCYAIPNGGQRNAVVAAKLKAEGVVSGVPDLHIPVPRGGYASLYIEMKNGKAGRLSDHQKEIIPRLQAYGNKVVVCRNFEEFKQEVEEYLDTTER